MVLGTAVAVVLALLGIATMDFTFGLLGATPELMPLVREYMNVWFWVAPVDLALWTMLSSVRARGNTLLESQVRDRHGAAQPGAGPDLHLRPVRLPAPGSGRRGPGHASLPRPSCW